MNTWRQSTTSGTINENSKDHMLMYSPQNLLSLFFDGWDSVYRLAFQHL